MFLKKLWNTIVISEKFFEKFFINVCFKIKIIFNFIFNFFAKFFVEFWKKISNYALISAISATLLIYFFAGFFIKLLYNLWNFLDYLFVFDADEFSLSGFFEDSLFDLDYICVIYAVWLFKSKIVLLFVPFFECLKYLYFESSDFSSANIQFTIFAIFEYYTNLNLFLKIDASLSYDTFVFSTDTDLITNFSAIYFDYVLDLFVKWFMVLIVVFFIETLYFYMVVFYF